MGQYAGLDVSLREISVCVVDGEGAVVHRATVPADPEAVAQHFAEKGVRPDRIVHESGQLSIWLQRGLVRLGLPAECIDARLAHKALSARLNNPTGPMPKGWRSSPAPAGTRRSMCAAKKQTGCAHSSRHGSG